MIIMLSSNWFLNFLRLLRVALNHRWLFFRRHTDNFLLIRGRLTDFASYFLFWDFIARSISLTCFCLFLKSYSGLWPSLGVNLLFTCWAFTIIILSTFHCTLCTIPRWNTLFSSFTTHLFDLRHQLLQFIFSILE